jgi:hypothetical protein
MPDTPIQTPSLINSDLATRQSTILMPTSLPRFEGVISCASPAATPPLNLPERRKKFRKVRLDIPENVTIQIADTPKLKQEAAELLRAEYKKIGYDTSFIDNQTNEGDARLLKLLVTKSGRASGTCSLMLDRPGLPLSADKSHKDCLNVLRQESKCLIELSRLTVASELNDSAGRVSLAALFSYIALCTNNFLDYRPFLVIEVAHRYVDYWKNLGFEVLVENSWCERVNIYVALLVCDWHQLWRFIKIEWQQPFRGSNPSNLLPIPVRRFVRHFIPWEDVEGINRRMTNFQNIHI